MLSLLPHLNAVLNALSTSLLLTGFAFIRKGRKDIHRKAMVTAFGVSVLFVISYLIYHFEVGSVRFRGEGLLRVVYFVILGSHTLMAMMVPPLAIVTLVRGVRGQFDRHRELARWTLPIWLYVNITGILVYLLVYQLNL